MEPIDVVEGIVRHLMTRPPAVGLSPEWDFELLYRDLTAQLNRARDVEMEVKARRLPGVNTSGVVRIDLLPTTRDNNTIPRLFARIEEGPISRFWRGIHGA